jgi:uncharacterized membrane protein
MRLKWIDWWDALRSGFWFVPMVMLVLSVGLAFLTIYIDGQLPGTWAARSGWIYTGGPDGARALLSTVAGSIITVAGVIFSITIAALTLASTQFGPRLLRNFMRDISTQVVLGTFVATYIYCLLVMRTIRDGEEQVFVPHLSVSCGVVLSVLSLGVLIYFIHHMSAAIQAPNVVAAISRELTEAIDERFPQMLGFDAEAVNHRHPEQEVPENFETESRPILAMESGYLQVIDPQRLLEIAIRNDLLLATAYRPGEFIAWGTPLVRVWPGDRVQEALVQEVNAAFIQGPHRTLTQDMEFAVIQLVEIAVRAMSPAINDPFTAMTCVDHLGAALCRLAQKPLPSPYRFDRQGRLRLIVDSINYCKVVDAAFNQIRQVARTNTALTIRLLEALALILSQTNNAEYRAALFRQAVMLRRGSTDGLTEEEDRQDVLERFQAVEAAMQTRTNTVPVSQ